MLSEGVASVFEAGVCVQVGYPNDSIDGWYT